VRQRLADLRSQPSSEYDDEIAFLEAGLPGPRTHARHFEVKFKDGHVFGVMPNRDDPTKYEALMRYTDGKFETAHRADVTEADMKI
jgi:hypothetical protein